MKYMLCTPLLRAALQIRQENQAASREGRRSLGASVASVVTRWIGTKKNSVGSVVMLSSFSPLAPCRFLVQNGTAGLILYRRPLHDSLVALCLSRSVTDWTTMEYPG